MRFGALLRRVRGSRSMAAMVAAAGGLRKIETGRPPTPPSVAALPKSLEELAAA